MDSSNVLYKGAENCVKLSLSLSQSFFIYLNLSLSLRDRYRADIIITFYPHQPHHSKLFKTLDSIGNPEETTYSTGSQNLPLNFKVPKLPFTGA